MEQNLADERFLETLENKPITPTLKKMKIGSKERFPIKKTSSIYSLISRINLTTPEQGIFKSKICRDERVIIVERIG